MLCPVCFKKGKREKMKCPDTRPVGPFERSRKYVCPVCGYETYSKEQLDDPKAFAVLRPA